MPSLSQSLQNHDLGHLRIVAEHWGVKLEAPDARAALPVLLESLLDPEWIAEIVAALPEEASSALQALQSHGGRLLWSQFARRFGEVREMGSGRRDRERPDRAPVSPAEILWYRGLVARAFFDTARGTEEFAYVPGDLLLLLPAFNAGDDIPTGRDTGPVLGRAATPAESAIRVLATDRILDHACTLLAALRLGIAPSDFDPYPPDFIRHMVELAGLLDLEGIPDPEAAREFLEAPRGAALVKLAQTWLNSSEYDDLRHVPGLRAEGQWSNDPLETRRFLVGLLSNIPGSAPVWAGQRPWWSLSAFIADIRQRHPDFQRPAGDYDSWFIKDAATSEYLRGFEHWDAVDGALIRYLIAGPLHWLGIMDLAAPLEDGPVTAFRFSGWAAALLEGLPPIGLAEELAKIHVRSDGRVSVPVLVPRSARYQVARFCSWGEASPHEYKYRLTPAALARAREQGLRVSHLMSLLRRYADTIPPNIAAALDRWEARGTEARLQDVTILRLGSPDLLQALRQSRAARFLGDPLGPAAIIVKAGAGEQVLAILAEMGYLGELAGGVDSPQRALNKNSTCSVLEG